MSWQRRGRILDHYYTALSPWIEMNHRANDGFYSSISLFAQSRVWRVKVKQKERKIFTSQLIFFCQKHYRWSSVSYCTQNWLYRHLRHSMASKGVRDTDVMHFDSIDAVVIGCVHNRTWIQSIRSNFSASAVFNSATGCSTDAEGWISSPMCLSLLSSTNCDTNRKKEWSRYLGCGRCYCNFWGSFWMFSWLLLDSTMRRRLQGLSK